MATSVQELINYLNDIEDKEQPVIYQYFLAEHFSATPAQFEGAVESLDCEELWDDAHDTVREYITNEKIYGEEEEE
jgi:hypothetical protein